MSITNSKSIIFLTSVIVGLMIFSQYQTYQKLEIQEVREPESNLFRVINIYLKNNAALQAEAKKLENEIQNYQNEYHNLQSFQANLKHNQILAGEINIHGKGVKLTLTKTINTLNLTDLVNEFWSVGAEAVAVNGMRITETQSGFADIGVMVTLNGQPLNTPLVLEAIGESAEIVKALEQSGGILSRLQKKDPQLKINLQEEDWITIEKVEK